MRDLISDETYLYSKGNSLFIECKMIKIVVKKVSAPAVNQLIKFEN